MLPLAIAGCFAVAAFYLYRWILRDRLEVVRIQLLSQKKRYAAALPILRRRLENLQRTKGEDHLDTAVAKFSMGQIEYQHGRRDVGKGLVDQATAIFEAYRGPEERDFVVHLNNLGIAQSKTDSPDLAIRTYERCLAVERRLMAHGAGDQDQVARTLGNLGVARRVPHSKPEILSPASSVSVINLLALLEHRRLSPGQIQLYVEPCAQRDAEEDERHQPDHHDSHCGEHQPK